MSDVPAKTDKPLAEYSKYRKDQQGRFGKGNKGGGTNSDAARWRRLCEMHIHETVDDKTVKKYLQTLIKRAFNEDGEIKNDTVVAKYFEMLGDRIFGKARVSADINVNHTERRDPKIIVSTLRQAFGLVREEAKRQQLDGEVIESTAEPEPSQPQQTLSEAVAEVLRDLLMDYQVRWLVDPSPLKIAEKGRQLGFTWIEALWTVLRRRETKIDHFFVSADEQQAKQFIVDCREWCERLNIVTDVLSEGDLFLQIDNRNSTVNRLTFPETGASIFALSSNPKAIRGKRGDVSLDEFAHHDEPIEMMKAAQSCKRWGDGERPGHLHIVSTHRGPSTLYRDILEAAKRGDNDFSVHTVTLDDALAQGLALRVPGNHRDLLRRIA